MKVRNSIIIDSNIEEVWRILAVEFDRAGDWMSFVPNSYAIETGYMAEEAPMVGRVCEFTPEATGARADERITTFDPENKLLVFEVVPIDAPMPVHKNTISVKLFDLGHNETEVQWDSDLDLKSLGYVMYPMVKVMVKKTFNKILEELKVYTETGEPHPRKLKATEKQMALQG